MPDIIAYHVLGARARVPHNDDDDDDAVVNAYYALLGVQCTQIHARNALNG